MTHEIEKACAAAVTTASEAARSSSVTTLSMLVVLSFGIMLLQWYLIQHWCKWSDQRDAKAEKRNGEIVDRYSQSSAQIVRALHNPMAQVKFTFSPPAALQETQTTEAVMMKGGKC
jgi:hypothetical protein